MSASADCGHAVALGQVREVPTTRYANDAGAEAQAVARIERAPLAASKCRGFRLSSTQATVALIALRRCEQRQRHRNYAIVPWRDPCFQGSAIRSSSDEQRSGWEPSLSF